ncbi:MAG: hypothetical protein ACREXI_02140 [Caldimonas sp.]
MKTLAFVVAALASGAAMAQDAGVDAACAPQLSPLQQRIYQKANAGPAALRDFIYIRRGILQLDIYETAEWAASVNAKRASCMKGLAQARQAASATQ